jgi:hypothetical protein
MTRHLAFLFIKIGLTIPVAYALVYSFANRSAGGIFKEVEALGFPASVVLIAAFLVIVFMYCRDLQRSLSLVRPSARTAAPRSVWLMFLIPYNFVEDFFIISNVASSLRREAQHNTALNSFKSFGTVSGLGWCAAQIVSILPHEIGSVAGVMTFLLWVIHWRFIRRVNAVLALAEAA